jgi:site-specific DNA recombinase
VGFEPQVLSGLTRWETIAQREGCSPRKVNMTISLAFLSPALVKAALDGRLPRGISRENIDEETAVLWRRERIGPAYKLVHGTRLV